MNIDPNSNRFCETVAWDSLTDAEKASGDWIQLPDVSQARKRTPIDDLAARFDLMAPTIKAINEGENRYRQLVLGQGPLPGHPKVER